MEAMTRVLIIDDSAIDRNMLAKVLTAKKFEVVALSSGKNIKTVLAKEKPDLVLLDVVMPNEDGNSVLKKIRSKYSALDLPVIMITGQQEASSIVESLSLGANDYVTKPVDFDVVVMRIKTQLILHRLSEQASRFTELRAISAMVTTYNHEINNPLTVALLIANTLERKYPSKEVESLLAVLKRIAEIVSRIEEILSKDTVAYKPYIGETNTIELQTKAKVKA